MHAEAQNRPRLRALKVAVFSVVLGYLVIPQYFLYQSYYDQSGTDGTRIQAYNAVVALDAFRNRYGHYPKSLNELVERRVMPSLPLDSWGRAFLLQLRGDGTYLIVSYGEDGQAGGEEGDEDIVFDSRYQVN